MKTAVAALKAFSDHNSNVVENIGLTINKLKHCGTRTKCLLPQFCLISTIISKALLQSVVESVIVW